MNEICGTVQNKAKRKSVKYVRCKKELRSEFFCKIKNVCNLCSTKNKEKDLCREKIQSQKKIASESCAQQDLF